MIVAVLREAAIQAMLLAVRLMVPASAIGATAALVSIYTLFCAASFYGVAWLVHEALGLFLVTP